MSHSQHHSFDIDLAAKYGIEEAILIHHFQHWIRINMRLERNQYEGRTWTYQTLKEIAAHFPYWSEDQVREIIESLCTGKNRRGKNGQKFEPVLIKGNFNKTSFDRTTWYAFKNQEMFTIGQMPKSNMANAQMEKGICPNGKGDMPNCSYNTDTKTDAKTEDIAQSPTKSAHEQKITFDFSKKEFIGISDEDMKAWKELYPHIDILHEISLAREWILSNPSRSKKLWRKFLTGWFGRANEKAENKKAYQTQKNPTSKEPASIAFITEMKLPNAYRFFRFDPTSVSILIGERWCVISRFENGFKEQVLNALHKGGHI